MRGNVGVVLGASGDTACLTAIGLPMRTAGHAPATPKGGAYTRNAEKREFYFCLGGRVAGAAAGRRLPERVRRRRAQRAWPPEPGSGLLPSMANFSILAPERS